MRALRGDEGALFAGLDVAEIALLRQRAARYAERPVQAAGHATSYVVFTRGDARYAMPLEDLCEIRPLRRFCQIPGASRAAPGVIHHRGEIISIHDLSAFMSEGAAMARAAAPWVLVVERARERLGLFADDIIDIEAIEAAKIKPVPVTFGARAVCFQGALEQGTLLLEPSRLFTTPSFFSAF